MKDVVLSVVVPVYDNAATLEELIDRLLAVLEPTEPSFELIFVDDGSRDASLRILRQRSTQDSRIRVLALTRNFGGQAAACAGFDAVRGRLVVCMDADLDNSPEDIPALLEPLGRGFDLVCGYRHERGAPRLTRRLPSWLMNAYVRRYTGTHVRDLGCGMRGFHAWVVRDLAAEGERRRLLTPVFLGRARTVAEVPLTPGPGNRSSSHSFVSLLGIALDYYMLTARRPFLISGLASAAALVGGAVALLLGHGSTGLVVVVGALLGGLLSLVGEYCHRLYQLSQGLPFYELQETPESATNEESVRDRRARIRAASS